MVSLTRYISAICLCVVIITNANSQGKVWSIGPEAGVNFSKYGMDADENETKAGFAGGIFLTYSVINTFGVTGKILYSEKGSRNGSSEQKLKYIEVPLTGRFFLNKEGKFRPNLFLGPSFSFLCGVSNKVDGSDAVNVKDYKTDFNTYDFGVTGGVGLNFILRPEMRLLIDGRYTYGLSDLTKANGAVNNETFTITAGVSFGI